MASLRLPALNAVGVSGRSIVSSCFRASSAPQDLRERCFRIFGLSFYLLSYVLIFFWAIRGFINVFTVWRLRNTPVPPQDAAPFSVIVCVQQPAEDNRENGGRGGEVENSGESHLELLTIFKGENKRVRCGIITVTSHAFPLAIVANYHKRIV